MALISAERFNTLKAEVKAECERRSYTGSVSSYAGTEYDYEVVPAAGVVISQEHYTKIAEPLNAISGDIDVSADGIITDQKLATLEDKVATLKEISKTAGSSSTGCAASCTGLCSTSCSGTCSGTCSGCTGCSGTCSGGCTSCSGGCTGCTGDCSGTCAGCTGSCIGFCTDACSGSCGTACTDNCDYWCKGTCGNNCGTWCTHECAGNCLGGCTGTSS